MVLLSALLVVLYTGTAILRYKHLPGSISALVFYVSKPWKWVWTIWVWSVSFLLAPAMMEAMPDYFRFVSFLTIASLFLVGSMPLVWGESNTAHYVVAIISAILSQVCVSFINPCWLLTWLIYVVICVYIATSNNATIFDGKGVFVAEVVCWLSIIGCILIH